MSIPLSVKNLTIRFQIEGKIYTIVNDLSFDLKKGKTLALVGESGCGKSMTALSILKILPTPPALPTEGKILYQGANLLTLSESDMRRIRGRNIAMIFQDPISALNPVYTIGEQLLEVAHVHLGLEEKKAEELIIKSLEEVHLPNPREKMRAYPHQLSGGMVQRIMIAMALLCKPDILIADEPTTALDVTIQAQILSLLKELQHKHGMAILLITHDMGVVAEAADEVVVMYAGEKIEKARVEDLFDSPSHPYTQALFASRPEHPISQGILPTIKGSVPRITELPSGCRFHPRCSYAMKICQTGKIPFFQLPQTGHQAKCWLFDKDLQWKLDDE